MQNIRQARQRLVEQRPGENDLLDFNTAAELAFRFTDDLHNYALTHASLAEHHHAREQWRKASSPAPTRSPRWSPERAAR